VCVVCGSEIKPKPHSSEILRTCLAVDPCREYRIYDFIFNSCLRADTQIKIQESGGPLLITFDRVCVTGGIWCVSLVGVYVGCFFFGCMCLNVSVWWLYAGHPDTRTCMHASVRITGHHRVHLCINSETHPC
jgi:hypothetical protein